MSENWAKKHFDEKSKAINSYYAITNSILGVLGVASSLACVSTQNPSFFAIIALVFIFISWVLGVYNLLKSIDELREVEHPSTFLFVNILNTLPAILGAALLVLVATGLINGNGIVWP